MRTPTCAQCGQSCPSPSHRIGSPPPEPDAETVWCSGECSEAWIDADPRRREGWIAVGDLTPERLNEMLGDVGLGIGIEGVGKPVLS